MCSVHKTNSGQLCMLFSVVCDTLVHVRFIAAEMSVINDFAAAVKLIYSRKRLPVKIKRFRGDHSL